MDQVPNQTPGDIVATRTFETKTGQPIVAILYAPINTGVDWKCEFRISGLPRDIEGHVYGADSLQALTTGVEGLRIQLETLGEQLWWLGNQPGWLGLSLQIPYCHGLEVQRRLTKLVEDEVAQIMASRPTPEKN